MKISDQNNANKPDKVAKYENERKENLRKTIEQLNLDYSKITLEIGCGHGRFLSAYAQHFSSNLCIGIDLIARRLLACEQKKARLKLENLFFIKAQAEEFVDVFPTNKKLSEIFILFPDPWPKRRHHKNRLIQDNFVQNLCQLCHKGARIFFRTDDKDYLDWTTEIFKKNDNLKIIPETEWHFEQNTVFQDFAESYSSLIAEVI